MSFNYIDLFAGCGGLSLGLHNAGWKGLFAIEKSRHAFTTLRYNLIDNKNHYDWPAWLPIKNHNINILLKKYPLELKALNGVVDLVAGGPPCQGFSTAGARRENDGRNDLVHSYLNFVKIVKPKVVFFENVKGFTFEFKKKGKKGKTYSDIVVAELIKLGYRVDYNIIDFSEFGIPQRRKRFILVGTLYSEPSGFFNFLGNNKDNFLNNKGISAKNTLAIAISDLLRKHGEKETPDSKNFNSGVYAGIENNYQRLMRASKRYFGNVADSHRFANHREETEKLFSNLLRYAERDKRIKDELRKKFNVKKRSLTPLHPNLPSSVLTSHPDDYIHYSEPRILTVREYARIQSFPDWFEFKEKYTTGGKARKREVPRYTQVGNAIPPLFAEQAGLALKQIIQ